LREVDLRQTADLLGSARPAWLLLAIAGIVADLVFRAFALEVLIRPIYPVRSAA